jgi:phosphate transport system permease protein
LDKAQPIGERSTEELINLIYSEVVKPNVVNTWLLWDSLFHTVQVQAEHAEKFPTAYLYLKPWINLNFITYPQSSNALTAGVRTAILGSLWIIVITSLFAFPIGVGAAIYLEEYAQDNQLNRIIEININNLAGVPSIIYGMLGLTVFVRALAPITSGSIFGITDPTSANGRTILSAGLTLALLILPVVIINAQEAIRAVPNSLREASYGLGATKWQTIWFHVLPNAFAGILTGTILSISRAFGETAPLVVIGASTYITIDPSNIFSKFTTLPIQIYQWSVRPQAEFRNLAAAAIIALLLLLITINALAILIRNRYSRRLS